MHERQRTLHRIIGSLFELETHEISDDLQIGDVPLWDSLGHAKLIHKPFPIAELREAIAGLLGSNT